MAELYLVRHGQAAFGTDDYDRLTELGHRQSRWLGDYFAQRDIGFDAVVTGTLRRHRETFAGIAESGAAVADAIEHAGLDEYQAETLLAAWLRHRELPAPADSEDRRHHFRVLRDALHAWCDGDLHEPSHLRFEDFVAGARAALERVQALPARRVLVVSSGGPISALIGSVTGMSGRAIVNLNLQVRNSAFAEFRYNATAVHCVSFNNVPHLDLPDRRESITYS